MSEPYTAQAAFICVTTDNHYLNCSAEEVPVWFKQRNLHLDMARASNSLIGDMLLSEAQVSWGTVPYRILDTIALALIRDAESGDTKLVWFGSIGGHPAENTQLLPRCDGLPLTWRFRGPVPEVLPELTKNAAEGTVDILARDKEALNYAHNVLTEPGIKQESTQGGDVTVNPSDTLLSTRASTGSGPE